jgi:hypothetical protein
MRDRVIISLTVLLFALTAPVWASESGCKSAPPPDKKASGEGLRIYVDPETGELLSEPPPGEQLEAPAEISQAPERGEIRQEVRPDGSVVADIGDRFITELRVEIVDGKVVTCHRSAEKPQPPDAEAGNQDEKTIDDGR